MACSPCKCELTTQLCLKKGVVLFSLFMWKMNEFCCKITMACIEVLLWGGGFNGSKQPV